MIQSTSKLGIHLIAVAFVIVCWSVIGAPSAVAQSGLSRFDKPFDRPAVSPYLNLFRNSNTSNSVLNYYGLVRPQQQYMAQNQQLNQQLQSANQRSRMMNQRNGSQRGQMTGRYRLGATGHAVGFMTIGGGVVGQGAEATGQNLRLSGFGNSEGGGFGATGNMPGFGGAGGSSGSSFGGGGGFDGGGFSGGYGGGGYGGGGGFNGGVYGGGGYGGSSYGGGLNN